LIVALAAFGLCHVQSPAANAGKQPADTVAAFGTLRAASPAEAQQQALGWLKAAGKADPATLKKAEAVWAIDQPLLDRVADTLALGDAQAAKLLAQGRDPTAAAPTAVPAVLKDAKQPAFYRANLGLAYAKALSNKRVYEEALDVLRLVKADQVVDPAGYFFHKAVAEHALLLRDQASRSIIGVLEDVADAPERYKLVAMLMLYDMQTWREKDLGEIARKMDNIERRLELARGGPHTQKIQKEVVARLDEIIKKLETQKKGNSNGGNCPGSCPNGSGGNGMGSPMQDSNIAILAGQGVVGQRKLNLLVKDWGKLPEKQRTEALQALTRSMPARHRELIEKYFKELARSQQATP
jgi:hypothetical protein